MRSSLSIFCLILVFSLLARAGNEVGNGGDEASSLFLLKFRDLNNRHLKHSWLTDSEKELLSVVQKAIAKTPVRSESFVYINGESVGVFCDVNKRIVISRHWLSRFAVPIKGLYDDKIFAQVSYHAYLECSQIEDAENRLSKRLVHGLTVKTDLYTADFFNLANEVADRLVEFKPSLRAVVDETDLASAERVHLNGVEKSAVNYPHKKLIVINQFRWDNINKSPNSKKLKTLLILHEYLGLLGVPDENYQQSHLLMHQLGYVI